MSKRRDVSSGVANPSQTPDGARKALATNPAGLAQAQRGRDERSLALDGARFLASIAIIWLHVPKEPALEPSSAVGRFAVPFFTQAAVMLAYSAPERRPNLSLASYATGRFQRIYLAFLVWSTFYALVRWTSHRLLHQPAYHLRLVDLLWNGTAIQLWFLPFILSATVLAFAARKGFDRCHISAGAVAIASCGIGIAIACCPATNSLASDLGDTGAFGFVALPSMCWGIGLAAARQTLPRAAWETAPVALFGLALWAGGSAWTWLEGRQTLAENLAGFGLMLLVLHPWGKRWFRPVARWGFAAFGIYLVHPFWLEGFENVWRHFVPGEQAALPATAFVFAACLSVLSATLLWRHRATRWLIA